MTHSAIVVFLHSDTWKGSLYLICSVACKGKSHNFRTAEQNNVMCAQIQSVAKILDQIALFAKIKGAIKWY